MRSTLRYRHDGQKGQNMNGFRHIAVCLDDEDAGFLKWLAKRDNVSTAEELRMIFWTEFEQLKVLYEAEMRGEP